jgi:hypothetical protein
MRGKETRGGVRWNSSTLHQSHKPIARTCTWCGKPFTSANNKEKGDRYCSVGHRTAMHKLKTSILNKRRVTKKTRKRHSFRPEVWRA